jgi:hypothetical protein
VYAYFLLHRRKKKRKRAREREKERISRALIGGIMLRCSLLDSSHTFFFLDIYNSTNKNARSE